MVVRDDLVQAAVGEAEQRGQDVADVPLTAIAAAAGISRSTLLRRLGGSRRALDEAVRAAGVDPGGRPPVRERALAAAASLIAERGLSAITLDAVADAAQCSLPSLHTTFGGRDGLLTAIFERYGPILDVERLMADRPATLEETVREVYKILVAAFQREPRVIPALFADLLGRPDGPARRVLELNFPRILGSVGAWLMDEVRAGRIRPLPLPVLAQMLIAPLVLHLLSRPALAQVLELPSVEEVCEGFAGAYLRGVEVNPA
jgi:AcrR family transcriptional regulator